MESDRRKCGWVVNLWLIKMHGSVINSESTPGKMAAKILCLFIRIDKLINLKMELI